MVRISESIIEELKKKEQWVTAKELAIHLNCSIRTIRNYIYQLNSDYPDLIYSSFKGYKIDGLKAKKILFDGADDTEQPQNSAERVEYIIRELTINSFLEVNLHDLADLLFISESSLRNDLKAVHLYLQKFNCALVIKKNNLSIKGAEKDKRAIISHIVKKESSSTFFDLKQLETFFPKYNIIFIQNTIEKTISKYGFYINDLITASLTRHLVITMHRIETSDDDLFYNKDLVVNGAFSQKEFLISKEICEIIFDQYKIAFSVFEIQEFTLLIYSRIHTVDPNTIDHKLLNTIADNSTLHFINEIIGKVNEIYYLDLNNSDFITRFSIHLKSMIIRGKNRLLASNPLTKTVKKQVPFLYEVSVFIAKLVQEKYCIQLNDDEITYIVFHLGGLLEKDNLLKTKILCTLFFPDYSTSNFNFLQKFKNIFHEQMIVSSYIDSFTKFDSTLSGKLLITSVDTSAPNFTHQLIISPFLTEKDVLKIQNFLIRDSLKCNNYSLRAEYNRVFSKELFSAQTHFKTEFEVISYITAVMERNGYVSEDYIDEVLEREKISSTAFGNFAIPHSMNMNSKKTGIFVLIQEKGIQWGDNLVNIVFLFSIAKKDRRVFRSTFQKITDTVPNSESMKKILSCQTFEEFMLVFLEDQ